MASRLPFRLGTRQRRAKAGVIAYAAASALQPLELARVGMLNRLIIQFRGTVTTSALGALSDLGPWNLLNRLRVNANIGSAALVDVSGFGGYIMQPWSEMGFRPDVAGIGGGTTPNADVHAAPLASGANTWVLTWSIPIAANNGINFETGLINLQAPETRVTVELSTGQVTDPGTNITGIVGNFHVYVEYYEIPDPRQFELPPLALVRTLEEQQAVGQTGDNPYTVPRMGTLLQLAHMLRLNGARSDSFDEHAIRYNKTDTVYREERQWLRWWERNSYGLNPVTGVFYRDFWHANEEVSEGDTRDAIDTEELSTLESVTVVSGGATLGANNNFLHSIRRIVQVLQ